ncbi:DnaD domain protein [Turicibacter sanguinis]|uniref:DnaD domain protein n=1 Tax=Turicibacter sanguinis TaxID=154288 RepID=UPI0012BB78C2|nr:DnaD domain protein [Turicibacter sanguinis]MCU7201579.1 DnaD domain protein [Turicibacter sanguinis]MTP79952.1 DnaD domain protein [Turicibacter sanguinis]
MNKSYYAIIPANVRYDEELPPNTKLLYGEITALANERGYCWASNEYFATLYKVNKKTISNWVSLLVKKGYIYSQIIYKESTKAVAERRLFIHPPIHEKMEGWEENHGEGGKEKMDTPIHEIMEDNNTEFNNTFNNTSDNSLLLQDTLNNMSNRGEKSQKVVADNIYQFYQQNFGVLSPLVGEKLGGWVKDLGEELVKEALTKTLMNGSRNFSYAETIMREWYNKNIKTLEQVQALELDYQRRRNQFPAFTPIKSSEAAPRFAGVRRG